MRVALTITAVLLALLIGFQFLGDPVPKRPFEDMTVALIFPEDDESEIRNIMSLTWQAVEADFGCRVEPVFTPWTSAGLTQAVRQMTSSRPTGICIMGYPADESLLPEMDEALDLDVPITTFNARFPLGEERAGSSGLGYAGINHYSAGYDLGMAAIRKHKLQPGNAVLLFGDLEHPARIPFRDGCLAAFQEGGLQIMRYQISVESMTRNPRRFMAWLKELESSNRLPDIACYVDVPVRTAAARLGEAGLPWERLPLIGAGTNSVRDRDRVGPGERARYSLLATQELDLQAYLAILQVCMTSSLAAPGMMIDLPYEILGEYPDRVPSLTSNERRFVQVR